MHSSLVMQDRETDTYWSIMKGYAIAGELKGTELVELPLGQKMQWKQWRQLHPDTLALSVRGVEDSPLNPYDGYVDSDRGFRGAKAKDKRLKTKDPIYAFHLGGRKYAVPSKKIEGGQTFELEDGRSVFLYRPKKASLFQSTVAFISSGKGFKNEKGVWVDVETGARFREDEGEFEGPSVERLSGFDTFWYNWSLNNPDTELLTGR